MIALLTAGLIFLSAGGEPPVEPMIYSSGYPRAFFFRIAGNKARNPNVKYTGWEIAFRRLMGVEGKALDEEISDTEVKVPEFFTRFKTDYPEQLVLLHFSGNARLPDYDSDGFFAGHWIYNKATDISGSVPNESGYTAIHVADTSTFQTNIGRFNDKNSDLVLYELIDGMPDWETSEQVKLISVDHANSVITVERGCYGTVPRSFSVNQARAAAHISEGPWSGTTGLSWFYNLSTECPRDSAGKNCADIIVENLAPKLRPDGLLGAFDGVVFDATGNSQSGDLNGDGEIDNGIINGINTYAIGIVEFFKKLRLAMGKDYLIMADGGSMYSQRGFRFLSGTESEGWPIAADTTVRGWSTAMNFQRFSRREAQEPKLGYLNHRFTDIFASDLPSQNNPVVPFPVHRLVFAAAQFCDLAISYSAMPPADPNDVLEAGIWDELKKGTDNEIGWLGQPLGPAVHLAVQSSNLLENVVLPQSAVSNGNRVITQNIYCPGSNLLVTLRVSCDPLDGYSPDYPRLMKVETGRTPAGWQQHTIPMTWVNGEEFEASFYFREITNSSVTLSIQIEGTNDARIHSAAAYAYPDVMYREFEHGLILANPSMSAFSFNLQELFPGKNYRRLQASTQQDTAVNNGDAVNGTVTLSPLDALFLVKTE